MWRWYIRLPNSKTIAEYEITIIYNATDLMAWRHFHETMYSCSCCCLVFDVTAVGAECSSPLLLYHIPYDSFSYVAMIICYAHYQFQILNITPWTIYKSLKIYLGLWWWCWHCRKKTRKQRPRHRNMTNTIKFNYVSCSYEKLRRLI